ncbi:MAG: cell division protein FtsZ [Candidatus Altiarchaeum hamiconexum]|uniref:Cell division protein FtsZ n=1 Tax=Candidatus Altarchaeum hamiconexum TaxID=1803513 RepID=A0A8J8CFQ6_9ARCH|nr:cell division protein FtsZ [Candidatus Altarchaeum hamiconexum]OIQ05590.1 MAG: cell division protein FtsZ [Candidatus Altarchaeum sp. CG2_30_32_3053]PIN67552.1 MAG: cell division protein FtsZ [Candidatus Altarchaeum sp. CG12_big_fil_rev_8_21_14_0_65_33_22]PIV28989.1 MAG: cell division protein FtsZ [Candidatus Altarchaeum sp. CG03_land_8_20_14_0_80_32_618]PIX49447.1 MAG: cell division protein FtsZ [Candidatus Altarchaeum sp. CG_4_8_14_3_um_filter_33_2054]PJC13955.1 MAG: cell division protein
MEEEIFKGQEIIGDIGAYAVPKIMVVGVGGAGSNNVERLANAGLGNEGVKLIATNTDKVHLMNLKGNMTRILIGAKTTGGMGAGGFPNIGEAAAIESNQLLSQQMEGVDLLFLTAGMGGGTGTGAAPIIAKIAKDIGALVVAIVTFPFKLERARTQKGIKGIAKLREYADTVVIIDNNKLLEFAPNMPINDAFATADMITFTSVRGISKTVLEPSLINLDFADLKAIMTNGDISTISVGRGAGPDKIKQAAEGVLYHPLLDMEISKGRGALIHITGGPNTSLNDVTKVGELITKNFPHDADIVFGARVEQGRGDELEAIAILVGISAPAILKGQSFQKQKIYGKGDIRMI